MIVKGAPLQKHTMPPARLELATFGLVDRRSFRLSYGGLVAAAGVEPAWAAYTAPPVPNRMRMPFRHTATMVAEGGGMRLASWPPALGLLEQSSWNNYDNSSNPIGALP